MKKQKVSLRKLSLKKSNVASFPSNAVVGGFQSWTGTAEPCFYSDINCGTTNPDPDPIITLLTCDCNHTRYNCHTNDYCPPVITDDCLSFSVCPPGVYCY